MREATKKKIMTVKKMVKTGKYSVNSACEEVGLAWTTWSKYKNHSLGGKKTNRGVSRARAPRQVMTVPVAPPAASQVAAIVGSPQAVANFLESYNG